MGKEFDKGVCLDVTRFLNENSQRTMDLDPDEAALMQPDLECGLMPSTTKGYTATVRQFLRWCNWRRCTRPIGPDTVMRYILYSMAQGYVGVKDLRSRIESRLISASIRDETLICGNPQSWQLLRSRVRKKIFSVRTLKSKRLKNQ